MIFSLYKAQGLRWVGAAEVPLGGRRRVLAALAASRGARC